MLAGEGYQARYKRRLADSSPLGPFEPPRTVVGRALLAEAAQEGLVPRRSPTSNTGYLGVHYTGTSFEAVQQAGREGLTLATSSSSSSGYKGVTYYPKERASKKYKLQGVAESGCKWSLIAQLLPGRSDDAVRNRRGPAWHRLEKAERQRREALEAGRPVEGYRCRKCGHFKKGHIAPFGTLLSCPA
ncbi:hypothetical protein EMIHUDRAFT_244855 [Emiliania huxleyi CCMP1516]|uniref:Myb-like domain-containing protein n=2 Tax=Emiliania huxleyi TaxID=2903 RepID=A0A0D3IZE0_EMIH1|nr:hypothetical protein EMIHUDRAFT_244855 [Emiliania huxleyi CCMP1516]EOD16625.1 hypothetical protein EMIHUDRAFT_244855 [Emiliania huxleyi CCMP1516]|eukprot:XP_005769054.1 hypothetical protein EMIHUDRAFT_244855 [Emiliania huxleyi CCMP1516]